MTTAEMAEAIMQKDGIEATRKEVQTIALAISTVSRTMREKASKIVGEARPARWRLVSET